MNMKNQVEGDPQGDDGATAKSTPSYKEFYDPRLVAIYDTVNPIAEYRKFYSDLATRLSANSIIDIGCGSGLLTCELAKFEHQMIGLEPSGAMIDLARVREHGERVKWINANAIDLGEFQADLAIMTGHVAQFFLDDDRWKAALAAIHRALKSGGRIAFECRNPLVQPWADDRIAGHIDWPSEKSRRTVNDPVAGQIDWWMHLLEINGDRVRYEIHYLFKNSGEDLVSTNELRFRSRAALEQSLVDAGFMIESVFGDWDGRRADEGTPEMIFVAVRKDNK
jgi:SAM-dependent methyltransferase